MKYPTLDQIESADQIQLCRWMRFLPTPGNQYAGLSNEAAKVREEEIHTVTKLEAEMLGRIDQRHKEGGGFTPEISKLIGWGETWSEPNKTITDL